ncbi:MAG: penicillin-binding protein activator LpoB [Bacteroidales bacterium]|nr:penicillin-binding protein activator LpoB [Bacteroidales bacterium]
MKKVILSLALVVSAVVASAQKPVVLVDYFDAPSTVTKSGLSALRSAVIAGINDMNRVQLIDVETEGAVNMEGIRRSKENAMDDQTARMGAIKTIGAQYVITGTVSNISADYHKSDDGSSYYNGNIVYSLSVVRVEDGVLLGTKSVSYSGLTGNTGSTADEAVVSTLARVKQTMDNFVNEYFKLEGAIVEMGETNKKGDKAVKCYINLGADHGMAKGQRLDVFEVKTIAGVEATSEIGALSVEEVVAGTLSLCKVTSGGKNIMKAFQKGAEMRVQTKKDGWITDLGRGVADTFK